MKVIELKDNLQKGIKPLYIVKGNDGYLRDKTEKIFREFINPEFADFNFARITSGDKITSIMDELQVLPVFDEYRVVVAKEIGDKMSDAAKLSFDAYLANPNPTTLLVLFADGDNLKYLEKRAEIVDCKRAETGEITAEMDYLLDIPPSKAMDENAKYTLISFCQNDLTRISTELVKLKAFADERITLDDVKQLVAPDSETMIYDLSNYISAKDNANALSVLEEMLKKGNVASNVYILFSMLVTQYGRMLHVSISKEESVDVLAAQLGVKSGAVYALKKVAKNYTQLRLKKIVETLSDMQFKTLSQSMNAEATLRNAVAMLMVL